LSAILHKYIMEYCKSLCISSFECTSLTQSALYLTCECALIGTQKANPTNACHCVGYLYHTLSLEYSYLNRKDKSSSKKFQLYHLIYLVMLVMIQASTSAGGTEA
jgi:hypothetical protein